MRPTLHSIQLQLASARSLLQSLTELESALLSIRALKPGEFVEFEHKPGARKPKEVLRGTVGAVRLLDEGVPEFYVYVPNADGFGTYGVVVQEQDVLRVLSNLEEA